MGGGVFLIFHPLCPRLQYTITRISLRSKRFCEAKSEERGFRRFASDKIRTFFCVPDTKFVSATNVVRAGKRGKICVGTNVSTRVCPRLPSVSNRRGLRVEGTMSRAEVNLKNP